MEGTKVLESSGDDCGGSAIARSDDAVAGMQGWRRWAT